MQETSKPSFTRGLLVGVAADATGRLLLAIAGALLLLMPFTEHYWHFDGFFSGGPDLELSLFALVTTLCLILVLCRQRRQIVTLLLELRHVFSNIYEGRRKAVRLSSAKAVSAALLRQLTSQAGVPARNLPLQV
jgi:hypothetical protein